MAIAVDTPVPTPDGWKRAGKLRVGDLVYSQKGTPQELKVMQEYIPTHCYNVEFDDGLSLIVDGKQEFVLQDKKWRDKYLMWRQTQVRNPKYSKKKGVRRPMLRLPIKDIADGPLKNRVGTSLYSVSLAEPIQYPAVDLPVPPYVFAVWVYTLTQTGRNWIAEEQLDKIQRKFRRHGFFITPGRRYRGRVVIEIRPSIKDSMLFAGADIVKTLPFYYVQSSIEQRREIMDAVMDLNECRMAPPTIKKGTQVFKHRIWKEARKFQAILESLGYKTGIFDIPRDRGYEVRFREKSAHLTYPCRYVKKIEKISPKQCVHLAAEGQIVVGEGYIPIC